MEYCCRCLSGFSIKNNENTFENHLEYCNKLVAANIKLPEKIHLLNFQNVVKYINYIRLCMLILKVYYQNIKNQ